jgi:hypothetical protein
VYEGGSEYRRQTRRSVSAAAVRQQLKTTSAEPLSVAALLQLCCSTLPAGVAKWGSSATKSPSRRLQLCCSLLQLCCSSLPAGVAKWGSCATKSPSRRLLMTNVKRTCAAGGIRRRRTCVCMYEALRHCYEALRHTAMGP